MLNYEFPPLGGGAGNATSYLLKEFSMYPELKFDLVTSSANEFRVVEFANNITIHFLDIKKNNLNLHYQTYKDLLTYTFKCYIYARKLHNQNNYDFCHSFFGIPCGFIALKLGIPYIVSLRGSDVPFYSSRFYWLDKLVLKRLSRRVWEYADKVITNSEGLKKLAQKTAPNLEFETINNGVDTKKFFPLKEKIINGKLKIISTGRMIERKGYNYLIEALKANDQIELTLIGEGNLTGKLKKMAKENFVNVKFLGKIEHDLLPDYLRKADIFVLPSLNEGMSNSVLEAMACGLPIITTDTGGSKEMIKGNGFVVGKGSIVDLRKAIAEYLNNRSLIKTHGNLSRKIAENISWNKIAKKYVGVYEKHEKEY